METLGKREAILAGSRLIREVGARGPVRLLELGCGEGQIIGALAEAHAQTAGIDRSVGVDYLPASLRTARRDFPRLRFVEGDFTDPNLLAGLGRFEIVLLVNALHEVFSAALTAQTGDADIPAAKERVTAALGLAAERIAPGGYLLLFDGLEPPGDPAQIVQLRFLSPEARENFETFAREFRPFRVRYQERGPLGVEISLRDFTRYIDKSIFLGKRLWQTERLESYQYFTEAEFQAAIAGCGLAIREQRALTVNEEKWRGVVEIETLGVQFPTEHILIAAQKPPLAEG